jgi:sulfatase maturation enzyme AslB (radical SAM superfamily)
MLDKGRFTTWPIGYADSNVFELDWPESEIFWEELEKLSKNLKVIYINGGEPTLIKKHWSFLETLVDQRMSGNIELNYSINVTNVSEYAYDLWSKFKKVRVSCSIDALGDRNTYIRYPSDWQTVLDNFMKLKQSTVELSITQTISVFNYDSLDEFANFFNDHYIHYNFVNDPLYYSPAIIPKYYRKQLHERYKNTLPKYLSSQLIKAYDDREQDIENVGRMLEITSELDRLRGTNFTHLFPDLAESLCSTLPK